MYITNPLINDGLKKFVSYHLEGSDVEGSPMVRYSDFYALRTKLCERWPGVYIPNIPPKKVSGTKQPEYIEMRIRILNKFCSELYKFPFLSSSDVVSLFKAGGNDLAKSIEALPAISEKETLEKYKEAFSEYYDTYDEISGRAKCQEFLSFLKKEQSSLKTYQSLVLETLKKKTADIQRYIDLIDGFEVYETSVLNKYTDNDENKLIFYNPKNIEIHDKVRNLKNTIQNPYIALKNWIEENILDVEAMIEALNSLQTLTDQCEKLKKRISTLQNDITSLEIGKQNFVAKLFKKKEDQKEQLEKEKAETEEKKDCMVSIIKIAVFNMESYMEVFKQEKINEYYKTLKNFSLYQKDNGKVLKNLWTEIKGVLGTFEVEEEQ